MTRIKRKNRAHFYALDSFRELCMARKKAQIELYYLPSSIATILFNFSSISFCFAASHLIWSCVFIWISRPDGSSVRCSSSRAAAARSTSGPTTGVPSSPPRASASPRHCLSESFRSEAPAFCGGFFHAPRLLKKARFPHPKPRPFRTLSARAPASVRQAETRSCPGNRSIRENSAAGGTKGAVLFFPGRTGQFHAGPAPPLIFTGNDGRPTAVDPFPAKTVTTDCSAIGCKDA